GRERRQSRDGRRPDRGVRPRVPDRQPAGDVAERLDAARPDREEHLAVRRGGAAAAAADLGRRGLGEPLVATRPGHGGCRRGSGGPGGGGVAGGGGAAGGAAGGGWGGPARAPRQGARGRAPPPFFPPPPPPAPRAPPVPP